MTTEQGPPPRRDRRRWIVGGAIAAAVVLVVGTVVVLQRQADAKTRSEEAARALSAQFAAAWAADDFAGVPFVDRADADVTADYRRLTDGLGSFAVTIRPTATVITEDRAVASYSVDWNLAGGVLWTTDAAVDLERRDEVWRAAWTPTIVQADLTESTRLVAERVVPQRGSILGGAEQVLVADRPVVDVGIQPSRVEDLPTLIGTLERLVGIDGPALTARVEAAPPEAFVEVITLRRADYDPIRDQLQPLPGTVFRERNLPLAPTRTFARALLGTSGDVTKEIVDSSDGRYRAGDVAGLSGLQAAYDEELAGETGIKIFVTNAPRPGEPVPEGTDVTLQLDLIFDEPAIDGSYVRTTLDPKVQLAAEESLATTNQVSSIVAVRPSTGEILAVANGPTGAGDNLAFTGQYPPGSGFKVVSTEALLANRLGLGETVNCPQEIDLDGRTFKNAENEVLGRIPFRQAFAHSCNTAFVELSKRLEPGDLTEAGARFGLGGTWKVGLPAFTGAVPATEGAADQASATFGQGRVLTSPLSMALVAATVADGTWRPPVLVKNPAGGPGPAPALGAQPDPVPLPPAEVENLRTLMRAVVTEGTATSAQFVPGADVYGKTGTAEFGTDVPPKSHAWFIGYQGDLAFAVFVDSGEFGGDTAVPIANDFLTKLDAAKADAAE